MGCESMNKICGCHWAWHESRDFSARFMGFMGYKILGALSQQVRHRFNQPKGSRIKKIENSAFKNSWKSKMTGMCGIKPPTCSRENL